MQARIGDQHPLHSTALGKAILAHLPADERLLFLSLQLDSMTTRTVTDGSALQHQLKQVARRGYAIEVGENEDGSMCIGVPILDERDYPIAAISLSAPEQRMTTEIVPRAVDMLLRGAKNISERYRKAASVPE
jgi:IclR family acetate operon transcriptional repressor